MPICIEPRNLKGHLLYSEQLALLKSRGMSVANDAVALKALQDMGYYRLSGYFYPLRKTKPRGEAGRLDEFQDGASFELVVALAEFDKRLRVLVLYAVETLEVAVRVSIAHHLGKIDRDAHLTGTFLDGRFVTRNRRTPDRESEYEKWLGRFQSAFEKSKEDFVQHHKAQYQGRMPIWVAIEIWDFGMLSRFFSGMQHRDQAAVAAMYGLQDGAVLKSWLRTFNFLRNVTAHHSRLWNRTLPDIPTLPPLERCRRLELLHKDGASVQKLFGALTCLKFLMGAISPNSDWHAQIKTHMLTFPNSPLLSLASAGFNEGWNETVLWGSDSS